MDKLQNNRKILHEVMKEIIPQIDSLLRAYPTASVTMKEDGTPVTELDLAISHLLENMAQNFYPDVTFYGEESFSDWKFPLMAIDPLDGTKEYIQERAEWAVSLALFDTDKFFGEGWIYNPKTLELFTSVMEKVEFIPKTTYQGEVSHSEWGKGLYRKLVTDRFKIRPKGSIAYKLGRLAVGKTDFVVSLTPKNIWDIAGGTLLCAQSGIKFYSEGKEVTSVEKYYRPPLIWCSEPLSAELLDLFCSPDKYL